MSYELKINEKDRTAARFINSVRKKLFMAVFDAAGHKRTSQQAIATRLGINRSVVNRMLRGGNLTLRSVAELAWALGKTPQFSLEDEESLASGKNWVREAASTPLNLPKEAKYTNPARTDPAQFSNSPI
jgi:plasmid maintenance system antidote protein VapI